MARRSYAYTPQLADQEKEPNTSKKSTPESKIWDCPSKTPSPKKTPMKLQESSSKKQTTSTGKKRNHQAEFQSQIKKEPASTSKIENKKAKLQIPTTPTPIDSGAPKSRDMEGDKFPIITSKSPTKVSETCAVNVLDSNEFRTALGKLNRDELAHLEQIFVNAFSKKPGLLKLNVHEHQGKRVFVRSLNNYLKDVDTSENPRLFEKLHNPSHDGKKWMVGYLLYEFAVKVRDQLYAEEQSEKSDVDSYGSYSSEYEQSERSHHGLLDEDFHLEDPFLREIDISGDYQFPAGCLIHGRPYEDPHIEQMDLFVENQFPADYLDEAEPIGRAIKGVYYDPVDDEPLGFAHQVTFLTLSFFRVLLFVIVVKNFFLFLNSKKFENNGGVSGGENSSFDELLGLEE